MAAAVASVQSGFGDFHPPSLSYAEEAGERPAVTVFRGGAHRNVQHVFFLIRRLGAFPTDECIALGADEACRVVRKIEARSFAVDHQSGMFALYGQLIAESQLVITYPHLQRDGLLSFGVKGEQSDGIIGADLLLFALTKSIIYSLGADDRLTVGFQVAGEIAFVGVETQRTGLQQLDVIMTLVLKDVAGAIGQLAAIEADNDPGVAVGAFNGPCGIV